MKKNWIRTQVSAIAGFILVIAMLGLAGCDNPAQSVTEVRKSGGTELWPMLDGPDGPTGSVGTHNTVTTENVFFLAPDGSDEDGDGTIENPWFSFKKAQSGANDGAGVLPGDTVYLRGGVYAYTTADCDREGASGTTWITVSGTGTAPNATGIASSSYSSSQPAIVLQRSGTEGNPITYATYPPDMEEGNRAVIDLSGTTARTAISFGRYTPATPANWIHLYGFDVRGIQGAWGTRTDYNAIWLYYGNHNTIEFLRVYDNSGSGIFIPGAWNCSYNLIMNCDFFDNHTPGNTGASSCDGVGYHMREHSVGNVFYGNRSFLNADDGYDSIQLRSVCVFDNNWSFYNGYVYNESIWGGNGTQAIKWEDPRYGNTLDFGIIRVAGGNGGGFKINGYDMQGAVTTMPNWPHQIVRYSLAVGNSHSGFNNNHGLTGYYGYYNTAYRNGGGNDGHQFLMRSRYDESGTLGRYTNRNVKDTILIGNVSYRPGINAAGVLGYDAAWMDFSSGTVENNTFGLVDNGGTETYGVYYRGTPAQSNNLPRSGMVTNNLGELGSTPVDAFVDIVQDRLGLTDADFLSFDEDQLVWPRKADGSLPDIDLMRSVPGGKTEGLGYDSVDTNEDGFGDAWKMIGARPIEAMVQWW